jgi:DNA polymerase-3 subunit delta
MRVYANQLKSLIEEKKSRLFILSGDELLLMQEAGSFLRRSLAAQGYSERETFIVEGSAFDWSNVLYEENSLSLFSEKKLIEVRMATKTPGEKGVRVLEELMTRADEDTAVIIVFPRLDARVLKSEWFKRIESVSAFLQVWPISDTELPQWIFKRLRRAGLNASKEAVAELVERTEGNLLAASQEIERLSLTVIDREITPEDIKDSVSDHARYDIFRLVDAALLGDSVSSLRILESLRADGAEPLFISNMLSRELRILESIKFELDTGKNFTEAFRNARVWEKRKKLVSSSVRRLELNAIQQMQLLTGQIDRIVKGVEIGDPWRTILDLVLAMSGCRTCIAS